MTLSITAAARILGISRPTLYAAIKAGRATLEPLRYEPAPAGRPSRSMADSKASAARTLGISPETFYKAIDAGNAGMEPKPWYRPPTRRAKTRTLSPLERRVALLVCDGLTYQAIADQLGLSLWTVAGKVLRARNKLNAANRAELVERIRGG